MAAVPAKSLQHPLHCSWRADAGLPPAPGALCLYTDIGLASTPDQGKPWVYRGVAEGLDLPPAVSGNPMPPNSTTQQFGGATWWRPAVFRAADAYHGFFIYNGIAAHSFPNPLVIHYTSQDLKHWQYAQVARETPPSAYDSDVFRLVDGRYILYSTDQGPTPGAALPLQSLDLTSWTNVTDPNLIVPVSEGPHVTGAVLNDLSAQVEGFGWLNSEGGKVMCTADGGLHWQPQPFDLFTPDGPGVLWNTTGRPVDPGAAHQGPLFPNNGLLFALYFTEFMTKPPPPESAQVNPIRSVLQLGRVHADPATGWLLCNRSEWDFPLVLVSSGRGVAACGGARPAGVGRSLGGSSGDCTGRDGSLVPGLVSQRDGRAARVLGHNATAVAQRLVGTAAVCQQAAVHGRGCSACMASHPLGSQRHQRCRAGFRRVCREQWHYCSHGQPHRWERPRASAPVSPNLLRCGASAASRAPWPSDTKPSIPSHQGAMAFVQASP